ncbi:MAG: hypothetical protein ABIO86_09985 [Sphingomonas sp.]
MPATTILDAVAVLPAGGDQAPRAARSESIAYTLSHVLVVEEIFRSHLAGKEHLYTFRNMDVRLTTATIRDSQRKIDCWYRDYALDLLEAALAETVRFAFVGGGRERRAALACSCTS